MASNRLSMQSKQILSIVPTLVVMAIVSAYIYKTGTTNNTDIDKAMRLAQLVQQQELEMVKMSEALRGYLLNPDDTNESKAKKAADDAFTKYAEEMIGLSQDLPDLQSLTKEMADFDAKVLNAKEDMVLKMVEAHFPKAAEFYEKDYLPARLQQNGNFSKLKKLVEDHTARMLEEANASRHSVAIMTIALLWAGVLVGMGITVWITFAMTSRANVVFDRLNTLSSALTEAARSMARDSSRLSEAATAESSAIQETVTATNQVSAMVSRNSDNAARSRDASASSHEAAKMGRASVDNMIRATTAITTSNDAIMRQVEESNRKISEITKVIAEIGNKTRVINDIVFQTKLLSFNASVEAARAGEHGKGFAVVAEEVGSLAQMSGNAAKEISGMLDASIAKVEGIILETRAGVEKLVIEGRQRVAEGASIAQGCGTALQTITDVIASLDTMVGDIHNASREQAVGVSEISKAMDALDRVTQENSQIAQQSAAGAATLESQSQTLQQLVSELVSIFRGGAQKAVSIESGLPQHHESPAVDDEEAAPALRRVA